jgi:hypothetical protein
MNSNEPREESTFNRFEMRKMTGGSAFARTLWVLIGIGLVCLCLSQASCVLSVFWPLYDYDLRLPSPDGAYDIVVLRGDAAAFDDFSYNVYVFPHALTPEQTPKGKQVYMIGIWRGKKYLIYSGYTVPAFRWTGPRAIEIDVFKGQGDYMSIFEFHPDKRLDSTGPIHVTLVVGRDDKRNTWP